jgi:hypothetical protein
MTTTLPIQFRGLLILSKDLSNLSAPSAHWHLTQFEDGRIGLQSIEGRRIPATPAPPQWPPATSSLTMIKVLLGAILDSANVSAARNFAEGVLRRMLWFAKVMGEGEVKEWILREYQMTEEGVEEVMGLIAIIMEKVCFI